MAAVCDDAWNLVDTAVIRGFGLDRRSNMHMLPI
jgi:hypothetical protein